MQLTPEQVSALSQAIGAEAIPDADALVTAVTDYTNTLRGHNVNFIGERDEARTELSRSAERVAELEARIVELSANAKPDGVLELSRAEPLQIADRLENARMKIDQRVSAGRISKAFGDKLAERFASESDPDLYMLSRDAETKRMPLDDLLAIIDEAPASGVPTKPVAGLQTLSRTEPADEPIEPVKPAANPWDDRIAKLNKSA